MKHVCCAGQFSKKRPGSCCTDKTMPVGTQLCLTQPSACSSAVIPLWLTLGFSALYLSRRAWMRAPYSGSTSEKFLTWSQRKEDTYKHLHTHTLTPSVRFTVRPRQVRKDISIGICTTRHIIIHTLEEDLEVEQRKFFSLCAELPWRSHFTY